MAIFHFTVTQTKRSKGQSAIASAAYRSGERLYSEYYGEYSDYTRKGGVICSDILLMAVFDVGSHIVNSAASAITGSTSIDVASTLQTMFNEQFSEMSIGELLGLGMETMIVSLCMKIMSVLITVILYGRMIEIYLYVSVAPVPCATVTNREWGTIGTNYFKGLCALAFQGFFMMVCVAIYAVLVAGVAVSDNLHTALWSVAAYTVILCFSLFKTGSLSKSIWNAH